MVIRIVAHLPTHIGGFAMRRSLVALPLLLALGCVPSDKPYYLPNEVLFIDALVGDWQATDPGNARNNPQDYTIKKIGGKSYKVSTGKDNNYEVRVFRLEDHYFADVVPTTEPNLHLLYKVALVGDHLELYFYDPEWMKRLLDKDPKAIAHERKKDDIVLTAPTKDLRAFALKYVEDARAFGKPLRLSSRGGIPVAESGFGDKKHRTLDYWYEVGITARGAYSDGVVKELTRITAELEGLSTKGVDAEAVECGKQAAATYKALLKHVEGLKTVSHKFHRAFERDGDTDRLGAVKALIDDKDLREQIDNTIALFEKTRETLAKRHGAKLMGIR